MGEKTANNLSLIYGKNQEVAVLGSLPDHEAITTVHLLESIISVFPNRRSSVKGRDSR